MINFILGWGTIAIVLSIINWFYRLYFPYEKQN